jgi:CBS-domain-containing membrane protein
MTHLTAADIMARSEATCSPDQPIHDVMTTLLKRRLTGAPVVDQAGTLIGMLTERDCLKVLVGWAVDRLPNGKVSDYMSAPAESIRPDTGLYDIVHLFLTRPYRKLPVVDDAGKVVGQVSRRDTLVALESFSARARTNTAEVHPPEPAAVGVDSAIRFARDQ